MDFTSEGANVFMNKKHIGMQTIWLITVCLALVVVSACSKSSAPAPTETPAQENTTDISSEPKEAQPSEGAAFPTALEELAAYDRTQNYDKLIEAAKAEGKLTLYTSTPVDDIKHITDAFTEKYGIPVETWRSGSEDVLQRVATEAKGGLNAVDVIAVNAKEMEAMSREQLLQRMESPYLKDLVPIAIPEHQEWIGVELYTFVQGYNTNKVNGADVPKTYEDLLDTKWKGQLGIEASDVSWLAQIAKDMGEEKGIQYFRDLVATNGVSVRDGHSLLAELVASGEVPMALTLYSWKAEQLKQAGAPFDWFAIEPAMTIPGGAGVAKKAPHPNAAVLFFDFMLSDGQQIFADITHVPSSTKVDTTLNDLEMRLIEPTVLLDEFDKWMKLWDEIIIRGATIQ